MKRILGIVSVTCLVSGAIFVFAVKTHLAKAQVVYENSGVDEGFNNDPYDVHGCIWRDDFKADGTINNHPEEKQAPDEFYIKASSDQPRVGMPPNAFMGETCYNVSFDPVVGWHYNEPQWEKLKDKGEAALWPPGCFNPLNFYDFASGVWHGAYGAFEFNANYNTWDEFYYAATGAINKRTSPPNIDLKLGAKSPSYGSELVISASPTNFLSPLNRILYGWATQLPGKKYVSQQGLVAGGRELTESDVRDFSYPAGAEPNLDTCRRVTRSVTSSNDQDRDGMDDTWERRYAPGGDITQFNPNDDIDKDGVTLSDPAFLGQDNKPLLDKDKNPISEPDVYNGIHVTPDTTANSAPGDGKFTNMEEFIWGTNPVDPDSDDDGFSDEADIVGLGQSQFKEVTPVGQQGDLPNRITVRATAVGMSSLPDEKNTGHRKIMIDSEARAIIPGIESDLQASLVNVNETPSLSSITGKSVLNSGEDIFVEADATRTEGDRAVLDYTWYVEFRNAGSNEMSARVQVPPTPEFTLDDAKKDVGRMGRYTFRHPLTDLLQYVPSNYNFDKKPGSFVYVTVEITNPVTHEFAKKRIPISIGSDQSMGMNITDLNTGETFSIEDYVAKYCYEANQKQLPAPTFCAFGGKSYNEVLPWIVFQGSRVEIVAQPIQAANQGVVYEWWINGEHVTESAADSNDNKLVIYPDGSEREYDVVVQAFTKDAYRNVVFSGGISMTVEGPQAAIVYTPTSPIAGTQVQLTGQLLNFPENMIAQPNGYTWTITKPDGTSQILNGKNVNLPSTSSGTYHVELEIAFQGNNSASRTLTRERDIVIASGVSTLQAKTQQLFASVVSVIRQKSVFVYEFVIVATVMIVGMLYLLGLNKKRQNS